MATVRATHDCEWKDEADRLRDELARVQAEQAAKLGELASQLEALKRTVFGKRSEKMPPPAAMLRREKPPTREETQALRRAAREQREELPTEEIHHRVPEAERACPRCGGTDLKPLGDGKRTTVYEYVPARLVKRVHVQETLACACGHGVVTARGAPKAIEKGQYGPGLIAHVVTAKCADSIPVYRLAKALERAGVPVARTTLGDLFHAAAYALAPLAARLLQLIAAEPVVRADETVMRVLARGQTRRGYLWTFRTKKLIGYRFSPTRSGDTPVEVLGGSKGFLLVDGYTGYNAVTVPEGRVRAGCWAHARRKFFDARKQSPEADEVLTLILELYRIERTAKDAKLSGGELLSTRWMKSAPVLRQIEEWLAAEKPKHLPKSPLGEAIRYAQGQWPELTRFLENAELSIDNNESEGALRVSALGRKNYLFVGNDQAGENIAGLYSLVATCEANGVDPQAYLTDVLIRVQDHPNARIDELLPHRWAPSPLATNTS